MSFAAREESRSRGAPQTLFLFDHQGQLMAYTDAENAIMRAGVEYQPVPIERNSITTSGTLDKVTLSVSLPHDTAIAELFRVYPPSDVVTITVFQGHYDDPDGEFLAVWTGRVISCTRETTTAKLTAEPVSTSMKRPGLRRRWQYGCPHALYGPECRASRAANTVTATVASVNRSTVVLFAGWNGAFPKESFVDGLIEWDAAGTMALRSIKQVAGDTDSLVVSGSTAGLSPGELVSLSRGCNHLLSGCESFANVQNFGGQPWIPKKNPIGFVNQFG